jgi:hypothetical protein
MAKKTRYEFTWVNHENNYELTDWVVATSKKEAIQKFKEKRENSSKEIPTNYTVKSTFLIV